MRGDTPFRNHFKDMNRENITSESGFEIVCEKPFKF